MAGAAGVSVFVLGAVGGEEDEREVASSASSSSSLTPSPTSSSFSLSFLLLFPRRRGPGACLGRAGGADGLQAGHLAWRFQSDRGPVPPLRLLKKAEEQKRVKSKSRVKRKPRKENDKKQNQIKNFFISLLSAPTLFLSFFCAFN